MKINRMANEKLAPEWIFSSSNKLANLDLITEEDMKNFESFPSKLMDKDIVNQRDRIEQCANASSVYHCNSKWDKKTISALKEYAIVCGMKDDKFKMVDPQQITDIRTVQADSNKSVAKEIRKAELCVKASKSASEAVELIMEDPFKLDKIAEIEKPKANWQNVEGQRSLSEKPSMMTGAIKTVRGGEDYNANSNLNPAIGQNSITNPNAIENFVKSEVEDTGARLKRENQEKEAQKQTNHKAWEQEKVAAMKGSQIIPRGNVFPTEVMNAQPGIYTQIDPKDLPERTMGESLAGMNADRKKSIRGESKKHEFVPSRSAVRGISDTFADELLKQLK